MSKKFYKVVLNSKNYATDEQIVDGCLGNVFGDGKVALYSRGEAIKKAESFAGKVVVAKESKFIFLQMLSREGENSTTVKTVHELGVDDSIDVYGDEIARDYYSDDNVEETSNEWLHLNGTIATSVLKVEEIDYEDYEVLSKYL